MEYLKLFEEFGGADFELTFLPKWKFDTAYSNTERMGFSGKIYQAFALNANRNGMRTNQIGGEHPTQMILVWNKQTKLGRMLFHATFLMRKFDTDVPYVLCLLDYNTVGDEALKSFHIRMDLEDLMGVIKNFDKFSEQIIAKVEEATKK